MPNGKVNNNKELIGRKIENAEFCLAKNVHRNWGKIICLYESPFC